MWQTNKSELDFALQLFVSLQLLRQSQSSSEEKASPAVLLALHTRKHTLT